MTFRTRRTAASFAVVFLAYCFYRLAMVPFVDPSVTLVEAAPVGERDPVPPTQRSAVQLTDYQKLFPPDAWERQNPIIIESDGTKLLIEGYENLPGTEVAANGKLKPGDKVKLTRLTIVFLPDPAKQTEKNPGQIIIMRAPEGGILQFDSPVDMGRGKAGKLVGAELFGQVTVYGTASTPEANDELQIWTRDLVLKNQKLTSVHPVKFRHGPNSGSGEELLIDLLPAPVGKKKSESGPDIGGIERLTLQRNVQMNLIPRSAGIMPGSRSVDASSQLTTGLPSTRNRPVDIRCLGPFQFDMVRQIATFNRQVDVNIANPIGVSDQLRCEILNLFFASRGKPEIDRNAVATGGQRTRPNELEVRRMEAIGSPVTVTSEVNQMRGTGNRLVYDTQSRAVSIEASPGQADVHFVSKANEFRGRSVMVEPSESGENGIPRAEAKGAGWCRLTSPRNPNRGVVASWTKQMQLQPVDGLHQLSMLGDAQANSGSFGDLAGDEIHVWMQELPSKSTKDLPPIAAGSHRDAQLTDTQSPDPQTPVARLTDVRPTTAGYGPGSEQPPATPAQREARSRPEMNAQPKRLLARGNVRFNSPRLRGDTEHLELWFEQAAGIGAPAAASPGETGAGPALTGTPPPTTGATGSTDGRGGIAGLMSPGAEGVPDRQYELQGKMIRARLTTVPTSKGEEQVLNDLQIDGNVRLVEVRLAQASTGLVQNGAAPLPPMSIFGDLVRVDRASDPSASISVRGRPAEVADRGMKMIGDVIRMERGQNMLWIEGPGQMTLPPNSRNLTLTSSPVRPVSSVAAQPAAPRNSLTSRGMGGPVTIDFQGGMTFDGLTATFQKQVVVSTERRTVQAAHPTVPRTERMQLKSELVEARLQQRVDFAAMNGRSSQQDANWQRVVCKGEVNMFVQASDHRGPAANDQMLFRDLTLEQETGAIHALGPGWIESFRLGEARSLGNMGQRPGVAGGQSPTGARLASDLRAPHLAQRPGDDGNWTSGAAVGNNAGGKKEQINYTFVTFEREVTGNLNHGELTLHQDVRAISGPVSNWSQKLDPDHFERNGPDTISIKADQLTMAQTPGEGQAGGASEIRAAGNISVEGMRFGATSERPEGSQFRATAERLSYAESKGQMVLEGNGRNDAVIYLQDATGRESRSAYTKINFWPDTMRIESPGLRSMTTDLSPLQ
ncbi:MAG: hypothetical protein SGJ20_12335 [Planctomycetota bacterium]|nr:hypothetical protein [Planctomycetota bacterium]